MDTIYRWLAGALAAYYAATGVFMLFFGSKFHALPMVAQSGPFNPHFVRDVGAAFLVAACGLAARSCGSQYRTAAAVGALFVALHAAIHIVELASGMDAFAARTLATIVAPAALAVLIVLPSEDFLMRKTAGRAMLKVMSMHYHYDTSYLNYVLEHAPAAFFKFMKIAPITRYQQVLPVDALFAAKITGSLLEDCGPCAQLVSDMACEAKMPAHQIEAVLTGNTSAMAPDTLLAYRFAASIAARSPDQDRVRDEVRARWGDAGVIELAFAMQAGRLFPMLKSALGYAKTCQRISVGKRDVAVVKAAVHEAA